MGSWDCIPATYDVLYVRQRLSPLSPGCGLLQNSSPSRKPYRLVSLDPRVNNITLPYRLAEAGNKMNPLPRPSAAPWGPTVGQYL